MNKQLQLFTIEFFTMAIGLYAVSHQWQRPFFATALIAAVACVLLFFFHTKEDILAFCLGAVIGPVMEVIAISFGAWTYSVPAFAGIPIWLPVGWGFVTLFSSRFTRTVWKLEHVKLHYPEQRHWRTTLAENLIVVAFMITAVSLLWEHNALLFVIVLAALLFMIRKRSTPDISFAIAAGILGPALEIICIHFGSWQYANPTVAGIPAWLPLLYAIFILFIRTVAVTLNRHVFKHNV